MTSLWLIRLMLTAFLVCSIESLNTSVLLSSVDVVATEDRSGSGYITHMELDIYIKGNILFSADNFLKTSAPHTTSSSVVVGATSSGYTEGIGSSAQFNWIQEFLQLNQTVVLVADRNNHCVRSVTRNTQQTRPFLGLCQSSGFSDGRGTSARLKSPLDIIHDNTDPSKILLTDRGNNALRSIDVATQSITTVISSGITNPRDLAWSVDNKTLYITLDTGITSVVWSSKVITPLTRSNANPLVEYDPDFYSVVSKSSPEDFEHVLRNLFVITYHDEQSVYLLNMERRTARTVCMGNTNNCSFPVYPHSVMSHDGVIYLGIHRQVLQFSELQNTCQLDPVSCDHGDRSESSSGCVCQCHPGYTGQYCNIEINECESSPCVHGVCTDLVDAYNCSCESGYTGNNCSIDINDCGPSPCVHGICTDLVDAYNCSCESGYTGNNCSIDINDCESSPCVHGVCTDLVDAYNCSCESGYTGNNCSIDINDCGPSPCVHGICTDLVNAYNCSCEAGYEGKDCDSDIDECEDLPCVHGACTDLVDDFSCECQEGYQGVTCALANQCEFVKNKTIYLLPTEDNVKVQISPISSIDIAKGREVHLSQAAVDGETCPQIIVVKETSVLRRLMFDAVYSVKCDCLTSSFNKAFLQSIISQVKKDFSSVCAQDCEMAADVHPHYNCTGQNLTVIWPTDALFTQDVMDVPETLSADLMQRLRIQGIRFAELLVLTHNPPSVGPTQTADGAPASLSLHSTCADMSLSYHADTDSCE